MFQKTFQEASISVFLQSPPNDTEDLGFGSFSPTNDNHLPKQHFEEQRVALSILEL